MYYVLLISTIKSFCPLALQLIISPKKQISMLYFEDRQFYIIVIFNFTGESPIYFQNIIIDLQ